MWKLLVRWTRSSDSREHALKFFEIAGDFDFQLLQPGQDHLWRIVLDFLMHDLLVTIDRKIVFILYDFGLRHEKRLGFAVGVSLWVPGRPAGTDIGQVVGFDRVAFIVERIPIGLNVIKPDIRGAAALGEDEYGRADPGIGLENARRELHHGVKLVLVDQRLAEIDMGVGGAEKHAVRHDDRTASAQLEHFEHLSDEKQLGLLGFHDLEDRGVDVRVVETALERGIGQDQVKSVVRELRIAVGEGVAESVLIVDARLFDPVEHEVHRRDAEHGHVEVEPVEHLGRQVPPFLTAEQVAGVGDLFLAVDAFFDLALLGGVALHEVLDHADQEAAGARGRVGDGP